MKPLELEPELAFNPVELFVQLGQRSRFESKLERKTMSAAKPNILLIEDDEDLRDAFRDLFEDEGYNVWTAANGMEALECLRARGRACLIFLDLMMPVMNGWEFRAVQESDPELARIPIVICTADSRAEQKARDLGAAAWLPKPTDAIDLVRIAQEFCRPSRGPD